MEGFRLIQHAGFLQTRAEHFHIIRIECACVFLDFIEVWIDLELCCLMRDDRYCLGPCTTFRESELTALLEVHHRVGVEMVDHATIGCISK